MSPNPAGLATVDLPTALDVFTDPVVQLAALCPICALASLKPEAALAAVSPSLALFNPAINPRAALLSFSLSAKAALEQRGLRLAARASLTRQRAGLIQRRGQAAAFALRVT